MRRSIIGLALLVYVIATLWTHISHGIFWDVMPRFALIGAVAMVFMAGVFSVAQRLRRFDVIDVAWGWVFIVIAIASYLMQHGRMFELDIQLLVTLMVIIWGLRLSIHIGQRFVRRSSEDARYIELRKGWKGDVDLQIFWRIYIVQAVLALIVMIPVIHINLLGHAGWNVATIIGFIMWCVGFVFEIAADYQLAQFSKNTANKNQIIQTGLWRYSRHPNYFGEIVLWWGISMICFGTQFGWVGVIGPALLSYLIIYVSGIPPSEKQAAKRDGWQAYKRRTNVLIPFPPRS